MLGSLYRQMRTFLFALQTGLIFFHMLGKRGQPAFRLERTHAWRALPRTRNSGLRRFVAAAVLKASGVGCVSPASLPYSMQIGFGHGFFSYLCPSALLDALSYFVSGGEPSHLYILSFPGCGAGGKYSYGRYHRIRAPSLYRFPYWQALPSSASANPAGDARFVAGGRQ